MQKSILVCVLVPIVSLAGCASTISAIQNDPARVHTLRPDRFFTLTGNSRLAFQVNRYDVNNPPKPYIDPKTKLLVTRPAWCAESLPEVATAVTSSSKPSAQLSKNSTLGTEDAFATSLVQTFTRTEIAEVYRQMGWQACQAWAQGVLSDAEYRDQLVALLRSGASVIEERSKQPINVDAAKAAAEAAAGEKKKQVEAAARKAKVDACEKTPTAECVKALFSTEATK